MQPQRKQIEDVITSSMLPDFYAIFIFHVIALSDNILIESKKGKDRSHGENIFEQLQFKYHF
jgi:hypothetical protein